MTNHDNLALRMLRQLIFHNLPGTDMFRGSGRAAGRNYWFDSHIVPQPDTLLLTALTWATNMERRCRWSNKHEKYGPGGGGGEGNDLLLLVIVLHFFFFFTS
jgi:hypothetical protein